MILQQVGEVAVIGKNSRSFGHNLGRKRATDHHGSVARIMNERAAGGNGVALVVDVVEDVVALAQRSASRGNHLNARVLQSSNRLKVARADLALAVEQRAVEIGDEEFVAHAGKIVLMAQAWAMDGRKGAMNLVGDTPALALSCHGDEFSCYFRCADAAACSRRARARRCLRGDLEGHA